MKRDCVGSECIGTKCRAATRPFSRFERPLNESPRLCRRMVTWQRRPCSSTMTANRMLLHLRPAYRTVIPKASKLRVSSVSALIGSERTRTRSQSSQPPNVNSPSRSSDRASTCAIQSLTSKATPGTCWSPVRRAGAVEQRLPLPASGATESAIVLGRRVAYIEPHVACAEALGALLERMGCQALPCSTVEQMRAAYAGPDDSGMTPGCWWRPIARRPSTCLMPAPR